MKVKLEIQPYHALPCALQTFTINGKKASEEDFGEMVDKDVYNAPDYGCGCKCFESKPPTPEVLIKYEIDDQDYLDICSELEDALYVGTCAWCS
jgi:hypothetical protein